MKTAILLAAHGTADEEAGRDLDRVAARARERFPGREIRWVHTSPAVRSALVRRGRPAPSPGEVLAGLAGEGYGRVAVQTLHVVAGYDFERLARSLDKAPVRSVLGRPLLGSGSDLNRVAEAVLTELVPRRSPEEALVLMAHGTAHPAGSAYGKLGRILTRRDPGIFLGCLENGPGIEGIRDEIAAQGLKQACLLPFLTLAGGHARRDLAGPGSKSWASVLSAAGLECRTVLKGLCRMGGVVEVWLDHLEAALAEL